MNNTPVVSVFSSIQGQGLYVGKPHLFIRFAGCNIRCRYCDTPEGLTIPKYGRIETAPFAKTFHKCLNPVKADSLWHKIKRLTGSFAHYHAIALTGGEPLLQTTFLKVFLPYLKRLGISVMLETNGTMPEQLKEVINLIDIVSMDIKIPSDINKKHDVWGPTEEFLKILSLRNISAYIKIVITSSTKLGDCQKASGIIAGINKNIPVILQPVSPARKGIKKPSWEQTIRTHNMFTKKLADVRIIPQVHRIMGWK